MKIAHTYVNPTSPAGAQPGQTSSGNWNDVHQAGPSPSNYSANGTVPTTADYLRCTGGGGGGITLLLTPGSFQAQTPNGEVTIYQEYTAMKIDNGTGPIIFEDLNGATINGQPAYQLSNQWQWVQFMYNGTNWDAIGN